MAKQRYHPEDHDKALPFLSVAEATLFRNLVKEAWASQGREITMCPDHAEGDDGCMIGFWNLAADWHKYPQRMWPRIMPGWGSSTQARTSSRGCPARRFCGKPTSGSLRWKASPIRADTPTPGRSFPASLS